MKLIDHVRNFFRLSKGYKKEDLASLCVLFGLSKEQLLDEYSAYLTQESKKVNK